MAAVQTRRAIAGASGVSSVLAFAALSGCTAGLPDGVQRDSVARFESAVASVGCEMRTERDYQPVELQTGLSREQVLGLVQYELDRGNAERLPDGGVRLTSGACQA